MAAPTSHKLHNAHYHPIKVTEKWAAFMAEMEAGATRVAVVSAILRAADVTEASAEFKKRLESGK